MTTFVRATAIAMLLLTTGLIGCARQPSLTSVAAPAPEPAAMTESAAAAPATRETVVEERRDVVVVERPQPATFAENPDVKSIYFDFDRYDIRPGDATILESDAAWLRTHDVLILIEGQCD